MINDKVIYMDKKNNNAMEKIEAARRKAEEELDRKIEMSRAPNVDVREIFTDDDLRMILDRNDSFSGKIADLSKVEKYNRIVAAAKWMVQNSIEVVGVEIEGTSKDRPNAIVAMNIRWPSSFRGDEIRTFITMSMMADAMFFSNPKKDVIRITFGVENIWRS